MSPMLFLLAMKPLHLLFYKAQQAQIIKSLTSACDNFRIALYADDAALFIQPKEEDLKSTESILDMFAQACRLMTNLTKTQYYPIRCENTNMNFLLQAGRNISSFPCTYLGLPLSFKKPPRSMLQPMLQKIVDKLLGWKRNFLSYPGRETLIKTVLTAMPPFFITVFNPSKWFIFGLDRFRRHLWRGRDHAHIKGGHFLVNWATCTRHKSLGGLRIKDI
jgi:hypothetical protein